MTRRTHHLQVFAHRGARAERPENTVAAFRSAVQGGCTVLETDLRLTVDAEVVCFHDPTTDRCMGISGRVEDLAFRELSSLPVKCFGELHAGSSHSAQLAENSEPPVTRETSVPRFVDLLAEFPHVTFNVDLKSNTKALVEALEPILKGKDNAERVRVASFHPSLLEYFRERMPTVRTAAHKDEIELLLRASFLLERKAMRSLRRAPFDAFQIPYRYHGIRLPRRRLVSVAHKIGKEVHVWTVNSLREVDLLRRVGVDAVITDDPNRIIEYLRRTTVDQ